MRHDDFKPYKHDDLMGDYYKHPTFGIMSISRIQGSDMPLFGSSILHNNAIRITISHADLNRGLNRDNYFERERIIECMMSSTQFADAITSLNVGCGTPVTLTWLEDTPDLYKQKPPYQNKVVQFNNEFNEHINDLGKAFDDTIALANETHAQKRLIKEIEGLKMRFVNNTPFINEQFSEQMENTIKEAKGEVESFVNHMVHSYGIEAIRQQSPELPETKLLKEGHE